MRLKHVKVFGFKTFADRTEFSVDGGIVAVVGPNGCGKSNLVDAVLWGLGETNSRHLRAATNQDVIFNGSARRKPVGFAEVSLTFDNEDRTLPLDVNEVVVSRRISRGGDSDYSINRRPCRLRDIYDLMSDSGLGRTGYSIVGQKEIDSALAASAEDRRDWIDEAAGVQRFRARKQESLRRLEQANGHLDRVRDILTEIESQREPLAIESERAHRYKGLQSALREVEVGLLVVEAVNCRIQIEEQVARIADSSNRREEVANRLLEADAQAEALGSQISLLEAQMDELRSEIQLAITAKERADAAVLLSEQRLVALSEQADGLESDSEALAERIASAELEVANAEQERQAAIEARDQIEVAIAGVGSEADQLRSQLRAVEAKLAEVRRENQQIIKHRLEVSHASERRAAVEREIQGIVASLPSLKDAVTEAEAALATVAESSANARTEIEAKESLIADQRASGQKRQSELNQLVARQSQLEGKRRGIEATLDSFEGLAQGSRSVLEAVERRDLPDCYWPVAGVVDASKDLALAIETALGASANDLITETDSDAKAAIRLLKERRGGRATFQPISLMRPVDVTFELRQSLQNRGVVGRASELIDCDRKFRPVIDSLLGRVLILESLDLALAMARTKGWSRIVTLEGEVVHSSGAVTGGVGARTGFGLVQRRAELSETEAELDKLESVIQSLRSADQRDLAAMAEVDGELRQMRLSLRDLETEATDARRFTQTLRDELKSAESSLLKLEREVQTLAPGSEVQDEVDPDPIQAERDEIAGRLLAISGANSEARQRLDEASARLQRAESSLGAVKKRLTLARDEAESRSNRLQNLGPLRERIGMERDAQHAEAIAKGKRHEELAEQLASANKTRQGLLEASFQAAEAAKEARKDAAIVETGIGQAEIAKARAETRRAAALERLLDEYGLTSDDAEMSAPNTVIPDDAVAVTNRLRRDTKSMGEVNLGAIEAYQRLTERFEELDAQKRDVEEGIDQVKATISELDNLTRDKFTNTFRAVRDAFAEIFLSVMGGGSGELRLTDEHDILNSGIEIDIALPGKKKQALSLLSGGERSLCATAFLFALLKVKPSPLVILDEVDAPLDGRNVERFAGLLQQFTGNTQFIVITHNPTTIEAAPVWLGVTMQEPGVSSLVPARLKSSSVMPDSFEKTLLSEA
jgi:chromosome segregation protein